MVNLGVKIGGGKSVKIRGKSARHSLPINFDVT